MKQIIIQPLARKGLLFRMITLGLFVTMVIPAKAADPYNTTKGIEPLNALITKTKTINLDNYPVEYVDQVKHALSKAEKLVAHTISTDEQLNLARLELQVTLDKLTVDLQKATILDLQNLVKAGKLTYKALTQMYIDRIELYDYHTIKLNSVRMLNPTALADAEKCDVTFATNPDVAKGMFGMPVLIKDNINVTGMPTTAGSVALADNYAPYDASLITRLKAGGAVILGKVNLTEFANYIAIRMTSGFSSLGGQVLNPYRPVRLLGDTLTLNPSGSSAGSGAAAAAALAAITIGTETSGSILSPSFANSIVGIKPTVGLISRYGIVPISSTQDTSGPMGRNVTDVAILLSCLAGFDPHDNATQVMVDMGVEDMDFSKSLNTDRLSGKRIGLVGIPPENDAYLPFQQALQALKDAGVEIVTKPDGTALTYYNPDDPDVNPRSPKSIVLDYDFAKDLPAYLATLDVNYPIKTLQHIVDFNNAYMLTDSSAFPFGQAILIRCAALDPDTLHEQYLTDRQQDIVYSREHGIDYLLNEYHLDCLLATSRYGSTSAIGATAGYPTISIPLANPGGTAYPVNLHFTGPAFSEAQLIKLAYVVEQSTHFRIAPGLAEKSRLELAIKSAQELPEEKKIRFQAIYDSAFAVYHNNFATQMEVDKVNDTLCNAMLDVLR